MKPVIISIANHKGGVQKTTTTTNLGAGLAMAGYKTLLIDCDAQQNLTMSLIGLREYDTASDERTLYTNLLDSESLDDLIISTGRRNLDIIPCKEDFFGIDLSLVSITQREFALKRSLRKTSRLADYDFVLIDNAPAISLMVVNALAASDYFIVPVSAEYLPMVGLSMFGSSVARIQDDINPNLQNLGIVITNFTMTEKICRTVERTLRKDLGDIMFSTKIRVNTKAKNSIALMRTIFEHESPGRANVGDLTAEVSKNLRGTFDYTMLAQEVLGRLHLPLKRDSGQVAPEGLQGPTGARHELKVA